MQDVDAGCADDGCVPKPVSAGHMRFSVVMLVEFHRSLA